MNSLLFLFLFFLIAHSEATITLKPCFAASELDRRTSEVRIETTPSFSGSAIRVNVCPNPEQPKDILSFPNMIIIQQTDESTPDAHPIFRTPFSICPSMKDCGYDKKTGCINRFYLNHFILKEDPHVRTELQLVDSDHMTLFSLCDR